MFWVIVGIYWVKLRPQALISLQQYGAGVNSLDDQTAGQCGVQCVARVDTALGINVGIALGRKLGH